MNRSVSNAAPSRHVNVIVAWRYPLAIAAIVVATCLAYWPALTGGFLWDDDFLLTNNPLVKSPGGLFSIWFTYKPIDYWPVTNSTFWMEWRLWGMNSTGYHVTNLVLHVAASLLVWAALQRLAIPGAFLAALLFAVHPVNVEAVAWIAQRKTILALIFFLLSILCYLKTNLFDNPRSESKGRLYAPGAGYWYWLSVAAFVLGMLSKGSVAILPLLLLLIAWWKQSRITAWDFARTVPFFLVGVPLVVVNMWFQTHGSGELIRSASLLERLLGAGAAVWFYLGKALLPVNLMFVYPQWNIDAWDVRWWLPLLAAVAVTIGLWRRRDDRVGRPLLFAWAYFCLALVPVLGLVDVYFMKYSLVADHYQYIALVSVVALVAAAWHVWYQWAHELAIAAAAVIVVLLVAVSHGLSENYQDAETLWRTTFEKNPDCWMAYNNLGATCTAANRPQDAIAFLETAIRIKPDYPDAENNLGYALFNLNRLPEAMTHFERSLQLKPDYPLAHNNLGQALMALNRLPEAVAHFERAVELQPDFAHAHNNLAGVLLKLGRTEEAIARCQKAIELAPNFTAAYANLGNMLLGLGRTQEAIQSLEKAVQLKPDFAEARDHLGLALLSAGRPMDAVGQLQEAVRLKPELADARYNLAVALLSLDLPRDAIIHLEELARESPNDATIRNNLGAALLNTGDPADAIAHLQEAVRLQPDQPSAHSNLGRALSKTGRNEEALAQLEEAVRLKSDLAEVWMNIAEVESQLKHPAKAVFAAQKGLDLARAGGQTSLAAQIEAQLKTLQPSAVQSPTSVPAPVLPP